MSAFNDTSVNPTGVQGVYAGVQNTSGSSADQPEVYASDATVTGKTGAPASTDGSAPPGALVGDTLPSDSSNKPGHDSVEGEAGVVESAAIAPLGDDGKEGQVVADAGFGGQATAQLSSMTDQATAQATNLMDQASSAAKDAYSAVVGAGK